MGVADTAPEVDPRSATKHHRALEGAGIAHAVRAGCESRFQLDPKPFERMKEYLDFAPRAVGSGAVHAQGICRTLNV
jgi:hypothetical protein